MITIGKYHYKSIWAFIQVVVFRKPPVYFRCPKNWRERKSPSYDPDEGKDEHTIMIENLYGGYHEDCGDR